MQNRITELRTSRGISARALAKKIGVSPSQMSRLEADKRGLSLEWLLKISAALDVPPNEIVDVDLGAQQSGKCDQALMGVVVSSVFEACDHFAVKPSPKEIASWISFVYDNAASNHSTFANIRELASTIVKVNKNGGNRDPFMEKEESPKPARKKARTTKAA